MIRCSTLAWPLSSSTVALKNLLLRPLVASKTRRDNGSTISVVDNAGLSLDNQVIVPVIGVCVGLATMISLFTFSSCPGTPGQNHDEVAVLPATLGIAILNPERSAPKIS